MTNRRLSKNGERQVTKTYASKSTKEEWKKEADEEDQSISMYLHNLIQEARVLRQQGRLKIGDRRQVEQLQQEIEELETKLERQSQTQSNPDATSIITNELIEQTLSENYKLVDQLLKELVANEDFQSMLRTELKTELYRAANSNKAEFRRGSGWRKKQEQSGGE